MERIEVNSRKWKVSKDMLTIEPSMKWDFCPSAFEDESFLSWFTRLSKENCSDTPLLFSNLVKHKGDTTNLSIILQDIKIYSSLVNKLKFHVSVSDQFFSLNIETPYSIWDYLNKSEVRIKFCPYCLLTDDIPYFRENWQHRGINVCEFHNCVLSQICQYCNSEIKYWETRYDQKIISCYNCKKPITDQFIENRIEKSNMRYHKIIFQVIRNGFYQTGNFTLPATLFFRQLWKILIQNSSDGSIKFTGLKGQIYLNKLCISLILVMRFENFDYLLLNPYLCAHCDEAFKTEDEYLVHINIHVTEKIDLRRLKKNASNHHEIANYRYQVVKHAISIGTTQESVYSLAKYLEISHSTIWRWIKLYREHQNMECLLSFYKNSGVKKKFTREFMDEKYEELEINENSNMKVIYSKFTKRILEQGYLEDMIPSYSTFRRYVLGNRISKFRASL